MQVFAFLSLIVALANGVILTDPSTIPQNSTFDYIIVGGGTAGLTIANRLVSNLAASVLVLEAGGSDAGIVNAEVPFFAGQTAGTPIDWNYTVIQQRGLNNRTFPFPLGKVLGGSSSMNYLVHQYGTNDDWNKIANFVGDQGWAWSNMQTYVGRHENIVPPLDGHNTSGQIIPSLHSTVGLLPVSLPALNQTSDTEIIAAALELGNEFSYNEETSGLSPSILGFGFAQSSMSGGNRTSSSTAYLAPVSSHVNLTVALNSTVRKLLPSTTTGGLKSFRVLTFSSTFTGPVTTVTARNEVILCAGAIATPQLLMLSGIGPSADLAALSIPSLINNIIIGANLIDSPSLPLFYRVNNVSVVTMDPEFQNSTRIQNDFMAWQKMDFKDCGILCNNVVNMLGYARVNNTILATNPDPSAGLSSPHFEIIPINFFIPLGTPPQATGNFSTFITTLSVPASRGSVKLVTMNPFLNPLIDPGFMTNMTDTVIMRESVRAVQRFIGTPAWANREFTPFGSTPPASSSDSEVDAYVMNNAQSVFHPMGSVPMSPASDPAELGRGGVSPNLTVKGTVGLRVADASVFPFYVSTHPQGAIYLLAERAADLIIMSAQAASPTTTTTTPTATSTVGTCSATGLTRRQRRQPMRK